MKQLAALVLVLSHVACGGAPEAPKTPDAPASPTASEAPAAPDTLAAPAAAVPSAGPSTSALVDANKTVIAAYPAPFDQTYKSVVAKLGEPKKKSENMYQWFALDAGKCTQFFMTKDSNKGHAASGISDSDANDCK